MIKDYVREMKTSVIITTHSMTEAEYLCNKIGILINGKFLSLAPLITLKANHS
jgi:ABC-type multidrug transport system ATPase subunit